MAEDAESGEGGAHRGVFGIMITGQRLRDRVDRCPRTLHVSQIQMGRVGSYVMRAPSREHLRDSRDVRRDGKGIAYRWTVWVA